MIMRWVLCLPKMALLHNSMFGRQYNIEGYLSNAIAMTISVSM